MYSVRTDHQIVAFGPDQMRLFANSDGATIVTATREGDEWTVTAEGVPDVTADNRPDAVNAMIEQALAALPGDGYSTLVPHGLKELP